MITAVPSDDLAGERRSTFWAPTAAVVSGVAAGNTNANLDNAATLATPIQGASAS